MKCMKMKDLDTYQAKKTWLGSWNPWERGLRWEREVLGGENAGEIESKLEKWDLSCEHPLYSTLVILNRSRGVEDLLSFKGFDRSYYRACVQGKVKLNGLRFLSRSYWEVRKFLDRLTQLSKGIKIVIKSNWRAQ